MKTRIELSKAYKKGIEVEKERIKKLIDELDWSDPEMGLEELKARITGWKW